MYPVAENPNDILMVDDLPKELVEVDEWKLSVWVYGLTGKERGEFQRDLLERKGTDLQANLSGVSVAAVRLCGKCIRKSDGSRMFTDQQISALGEKSAIPIQKLYEVAQRLSGLTKERIKELEKALEDDPNAVASSSSA